MPKDELVYVGYMLDTAERALRLVAGKTRADFNSDEPLRLALTHLIQTIGEAFRRVSPEFRADHPHVPWATITAMRHKIVHDYFDIDENLVVLTTVNDLEPLVAALRPLIPPGIC